MSTHGQGSTNKGNQKGGDQKPKPDQGKSPAETSKQSGTGKPAPAPKGQ